MLSGHAALVSPLMLTATTIQTVIFSSRTDGRCMVGMGPADIVSCSTSSQSPKLCSNVFNMLVLSLFFLLKLRRSICHFIAQHLLCCGPCSLHMTEALLGNSCSLPSSVLRLCHVLIFLHAYMNCIQNKCSTAAASCSPIWDLHLFPVTAGSAIARCLGILVLKERGSALTQSTDKVFSPTALLSFSSICIQSSRK